MPIELASFAAGRLLRPTCSAVMLGFTVPITPITASTLLVLDTRALRGRR